MMMNKVAMKKGIIRQQNVPVSMRDGTKLYADIYRPNDQIDYPILLLRTPYNKEDAQTMNYAHPIWYAQQGYVVIVQDTRGRWSSEGEFNPLVHEGTDGCDTIEWAVTLPYTIPKVGMYGFSFIGFSQLLTAAEQPPHLACIAPFMCGSNSIKVSENGAFPLAQNLSWAIFVSQNEAIRKKDVKWLQQLATTNIQELYKYLPLQDVPIIKNELAPFYQKWIQQAHEKQVDSSSLYENILVPGLHLGGWYDMYVDKTIGNYEGIKEKSKNENARENQYLILTPWYHMPWSRYVGQIDFGKNAENRVNEIQIKWFDRWLKDSPTAWEEDPVRYFITGENEWHVSKHWPLPESESRVLYLSSEDRANSINGSGKLAEEISEQNSEKDIYVYHPSIYVPAIGGRSGPDPVQTPMGAQNQQPIEIRNDVLVYTSDILTEDVDVVGEVNGELYISTTVEDTDFAVKFIDVFPDGRSVNVAEGLLRASARNGIDQREALIPNKVYQLDISAGSIAHRFKKGHAIRLNITSTLFPTFDRHCNQFLPLDEVTELTFKTATQTVYHNEQYPSNIRFTIKNSHEDSSLVSTI